MKRVWGQTWGVVALSAVLLVVLIAAIRPVPPRLVPYTSPPLTLGNETFRVEMRLPEDWEMDVPAAEASDKSVNLGAQPVHRPTLWELVSGHGFEGHRGGSSVDVWLLDEKITPEKTHTSSSGGGGPYTYVSRQFGRIGASVFCRRTGGGYDDEQIGRRICESFRVIPSDRP